MIKFPCSCKCGCGNLVARKGAECGPCFGECGWDE